MSEGDDFLHLLDVMVERHPDVAPAHWPADDLDRLIEDWGTVAYRAFKSLDLITWLLACNFALALRHARLVRRMKGRYR